MIMIKLIVSDIDGTLLNSNGELPKEFYSLFDKLYTKDIFFAVASGRQYYSLLSSFEPIKDKIIFIAENGSFVMRNNEELFCKSLNRDYAENIVRDVRASTKYDIVLCCKKSAYVESSNDGFNSEVKKYYTRCEVVDDILSVDDEVFKIAVFDYENSQKYCFNEFSPKWKTLVNVVVSGKHWVDFGRIDVDKGIGLSTIQNTLGISANETLSFGDYFNDVPMFETSYYSYAMENANADVKAAARFIAPSNNNNGVIKVILDLEKQGLI
jgi:Cof subfamily protein (haloacid dehalogenase superfamily)